MADGAKWRKRRQLRGSSGCGEKSRTQIGERMEYPIVQSPSILKSTTSQPELQATRSSVVAPSPIKKKLSLADYMSRCGTLTTTILEKDQIQAIFIPQAKTSPATQQIVNSRGTSTETHFAFGK